MDKEPISAIGKGILVFAAVAPGDTEKDVNTLAAKVLKMRLWDDETGGRVRVDFLIAGLLNFPKACVYSEFDSEYLPFIAGSMSHTSIGLMVVRITHEFPSKFATMLCNL